MVGAFGEVQVMDWGLAKDAWTHDPGTPGGETLTDIAARPTSATETVAGQVKGTPAYMAPEQARGEKVGPAADVFALGGILGVMLTGKPPFLGETVLDTVLKAAQAELGECFTRLATCGADPELVAVAKRCLAADAGQRFANGQEVAEAIAAYRARVEERLRQAERDRAVSETATRELRKRRKVQLALAAAVLLLVSGVAAVTWWENAQATARKNEHDRDEVTQQATLRAADAIAQEKQRVAQRETRAAVQALATADTAGVARLIVDLKEYRDLTGPKLRELAAQPVTTKPGLHGRLALLADEPGRAAELAAYLPACRPEELLPVRPFLVPHAAAVAPAVWAVLLDENAVAGTRVRAACALAGLAPADARWNTVAPALTDLVVRENALQAVVWAQALEPVRGHLLPALVERYAVARDRVRDGKLDASTLVTVASALDLTANLLARYTTDRPEILAELAMTVDARHHALFADAMKGTNRAAVVPLLKAELGKRALPVWAGNGEFGPTLAAVVGVAPVAGLLNPDPAFDALAKRRANAAAALLALGEAESVWPLLAFPKDGDPSARSYLIQRLAAIGADPGTLVQRFGAETDVSAKRALLIALGDFPPDSVPVAAREPFVSRLLVLYRNDPDPGMHGAIDWLLRQKWGRVEAVRVIDAELATVARGRVAVRILAGAVPAHTVLPSAVGSAVGARLPAPAVDRGKDWFVNGEGQTYAVVRGPVEFVMGSPSTEAQRNAANEPAHRKRIERSFALSTKQVTVAEFRRFRPKHAWMVRFSPGPDTPAVGLTWYECAAYCNWLSEREGVPRDQWCYEPNSDGEFAEGMRIKPGHLARMGYRLPTEAEWEYASRGGSGVSRHFGRGEELLTRYGWYAKNAEDRAWPVGALRPNDLGLFDTMGNAFEWVADPVHPYLTGQSEDGDNGQPVSIDEQPSRLLRGGAFFITPAYLRSACRDFCLRPGNRGFPSGFRPTKTLP